MSWGNTEGGWGLNSKALGFQMPTSLDAQPSPTSALLVNNWLATVTLGQAGMHATYYHKASDQVSWRKCMVLSPQLGLLVLCQEPYWAAHECAWPSLPPLASGGRGV